MAATVKIARATDTQTGSSVLVHLPSQFGMQGADCYDPEIHDNLRCHCCDAAMNYNKGSEAIGGSSRHRRSDFFKLASGARHENCRYPNPDPDKSSAEYDVRLGFRVHFNIPDLSGHFNQSSIYRTERDLNGARRKRVINTLLPPKVTPADWRAMETISVSSVQEFLSLMKNKDWERLKGTYVVIGHRIMKLNEFVVRAGMANDTHANPRFAKLIHDFETDSMAKFGLPRIMEVELTEPPKIDLFSDRFSLSTKAIYLDGDNKDGEKHFVLPRIHVDTTRCRELSFAFKEAGKYSVLGLFRQSVAANGNHFINVSVTDSKQIEANSPSDIFARRLAKREEAKELNAG